MQTGTSAAAAGAPPPVAGVDGVIERLVAAYESSLAIPGIRILVVVLFLAVGAVVSTYAVRLLGRPVARQFVRESVAHVVLRGVRLVVILLFGAAGLSAAGVELGSIVLSVTVFSAVVAVVLAPIVGSVISGVFVLADQPFEIGDMVELPDGTRGFVDDITLRYTKVFTVDNTFEVIPNSYIRDQRITNLSAEDKRTRLTLPILVTYESDVAQARRLIERAAASCDTVIEGGPDIRIGVARYPAKPTCYIDAYGDHGVEITLRYWAKDPYKPLTVRSQVQTAIADLLEKEDADVEFAYPHSHLVFDDTSGVAEVAVRDRVSAGPRPDPAAHDPPADGGSDAGITPETPGDEAPQTDAAGDADQSTDSNGAVSPTDSDGGDGPSTGGTSGVGDGTN